MMLIDEDTGMRPETPWHLWVVASAAIIWNMGGAFDYVMKQSRNAGYLSDIDPKLRTIVETMPIWAQAAWTVAISASVIGSVLLLFKSRYAGPVYMTALGGMALSYFNNLVIAGGFTLMGSIGAALFTLVVVGIAIALYLYAMRMIEKGVLV